MYLGSNVKTDNWSNDYNQRPYSDLTGTMRELTSTNKKGDTDKRFQPPLDTSNQKIQPPIAEGYRLASTELISPAISLSLNKDIPNDRRKRDIPLDNTTISTVTLSSTTSINTQPISTTSASNLTDEDLILNAADSNSWALSLSLALDGSGSEIESKLVIQLNDERKRMTKLLIHDVTLY